MKTRFGRVVLIVAGMIVFAASTAIASDQTVDVNVFPEDELSIWVQENVGFQAEVNQLSDQQYFDMQITNTSDSDWQVTATSTDLEGFDQDNCDELGCEESPNGKTIPASALHLRGADGTGWEDEQADDVIALEGDLDNSTPLVIMEGIGDLYGSFGFNEQPWLQLTVPDDDTLPGAYRATVTYTIEPATP
jgi:hypothetical protein